MPSGPGYSHPAVDPATQLESTWCEEGFVPPSLDDVQQEIVEALRRGGIAVVPFHELLRNEELWATLDADIASFVDATEAQLDELRSRDDPKAYIARRFTTKTKFRLDDPWLRLGLSSRILDVVNTYRGELTRLVYLDHWYTIPDEEAV